MRGSIAVVKGQNGTFTVQIKGGPDQQVLWAIEVQRPQVIGPNNYDMGDVYQARRVAIRWAKRHGVEL